MLTSLAYSLHFLLATDTFRQLYFYNSCGATEVQRLLEAGNDPCHQKTSSSFCNNHGTPSKSGSTCVCTPCDGGYSGTRCENDPCHQKTRTSFCNNRGTPTTNGDTCVCTPCDAGYTGTHCETQTVEEKAKQKRAKKAAEKAAKEAADIAADQAELLATLSGRATSSKRYWPPRRSGPERRRARTASKEIPPCSRTSKG